MQIGYENNPGEPIDIACNAWAEYLDELSGGTMKMQVYPSSQLGSKNDIIDQMLAGNNVITLADGAFMADRGAPDMGIQFAPFLFDTYDDAWALVNSDWWQEQVDICAENGLQILTSNFVYGTRNLMTTTSVKGVDDLKGLKIRVPNNTIQIKGFEALGATATPLPLGDVYTALQQKTIDGVENPAPALVGLGFGEVAKHLIVDKHVLNTTLWLCGTEWFNTLTEDQQGWLMESGNKAGLVSQQLDIELEQEALDKLEEQGVEIYYPTADEIKGFKEAALGFYEYSQPIDVLIVGEMGKDFSGDGMDSNVIGRFPSPAIKGDINIQHIVVLDLSDESQGNGNGIGLADVTTKKLISKLKPEPTYANSITSTCLNAVKLPIIANNPREAVQIALKTCVNIDFDKPRIIYIDNTLDLETIYISEGIKAEALGMNNVTIESLDGQNIFNQEGEIEIK